MLDGISIINTSPESDRSALRSSAPFHNATGTGVLSPSLEIKYEASKKNRD